MAAALDALAEHGKPCPTTELREMVIPRLDRVLIQATFAYTLRKFATDRDSPLVDLGWRRGPETHPVWTLIWGLESWGLDREHPEMDYLLSARRHRRRSPRRREPEPAPRPAPLTRRAAEREVVPSLSTLTLGIGDTAQIVGVRLHDNGSDHVFTLRTNGGDVDVTLA